MKFMKTWKIKIYCRSCGKDINDDNHSEFKKVKSEFKGTNFIYICPCGSGSFYITGIDYTVLEDNNGK